MSLDQCDAILERGSEFSMSINIQAWLSELPTAAEETGGGIVLEGFLLPSEADKIRIIVGGLCLSFLKTDVLEMESVNQTEDRSGAQFERGIRAVVRHGAAILDIRLRELCGLETPKRPFPLSARPPTITLSTSTRFRNLEQQFLQRHSLIEK